MSLQTETQSYDSMYASIENMVKQLAWKFTKKYGGDFEEWLSDANASCAVALTRYNTDRKVKLTTWVYRFVYFDLITAVTQRTKYYQHHEQLDEVTHDEGTTVSSRIADLSEDAQTIIQLFAAAPAEVLDLVGGRATAAAIRKGVKSYLMKAGWTTEKYASTLTEIEEILT